MATPWTPTGPGPGTDLLVLQDVLFQDIEDVNGETLYIIGPFTPGDTQREPTN